MIVSNRLDMKYMRLTLKAHSQCRATLKGLAEMKNFAPLTFVKEANTADNQQVNNEAAGVARMASITRSIRFSASRCASAAFIVLGYGSVALMSFAYCA
jgi:hypothetical protein